MFNYHEKEFDKFTLTNLDSIKVNQNPASDNELSNKKHFDEELNKNTILIFNQFLQNHLKLTVGNSD